MFVGSSVAGDTQGHGRMSVHTRGKAHSPVVSFFFFLLFLAVFLLTPTQAHTHSLGRQRAPCMSGLYPNTATVAKCYNYYQMEPGKKH